MTYQQLVAVALKEIDNTETELHRLDENQARRKFFRKIAIRQELDTIAIALTTKN